MESPNQPITTDASASAAGPAALHTAKGIVALGLFAAYLLSPLLS